MNKRSKKKKKKPIKAGTAKLEQPIWNAYLQGGKSHGKMLEFALPFSIGMFIEVDGEDYQSQPGLIANTLAAGKKAGGNVAVIFKHIKET